MQTLTRTTSPLIALAALAATASANAALILDTSVTSTFSPFTTTTGTVGNDLPGKPSYLNFGQLAANQNGYVDFFYIGNEAAYTNTLVVNDTTVYSSLNKPDTFYAPYPVVATSSINAGSFVDFGFCTDGGLTVGIYGRCAYNDSAASLTAQYNANGGSGYRSIGFRSLTSFNPTVSGAYSFGTSALSDLWMIFWDDSGAKNDDNHDDFIAVARFRPMAVAEPSTALLLGGALLGLGFVRLRRRNAA